MMVKLTKWGTVFLCVMFAWLIRLPVGTAWAEEAASLQGTGSLVASTGITAQGSTSVSPKGNVPEGVVADDASEDAAGKAVDDDSAGDAVSDDAGNTMVGDAATFATSGDTAEGSASEGILPQTMPPVVYQEDGGLIAEGVTSLTYQGSLKVGDVLSGIGTVRASNERVIASGNNMFDLTFAADDPNFPGQTCDGQCQDYGYVPPLDFAMDYTFTVSAISGNEAAGWLLCRQPASIIGRYQRVGYTIYVTFLNPGTVNIHKADATTGLYEGQGGASLAGAEYTLTNVGTTASWTLSTDENGYATVGELPLGDYTLRETKAADGYLINETIYTFTLASGTEGQEVYDCYTTDTLDYGRLKIVKRDGNTKAGLPQAGFELYRQDGEDWTKIGDTYRTGDDGTVEIDGLIWGRYRIIETESPAGYMDPLDHGDIDMQEIVLTSSSLVEVDFDDYRYGTLGILKVDGHGQNAIAGGMFEVYRNAEPLTAEMADKNGADVVEAAFENWIKIGDTYTSDAEGRIAIDGLRYGDYKIIEVKAPEGYMLPSEHGDPDVQYVTLSDSASDATVTFMDYPFGTVIVEKDTTADGSPIAGTDFEVSKKQADGSWLKVGDTLSTDADGRAILNDLTYGDYRVVEVRPNASYLSGSENGQTDVEYFTLDDTTTQALQIFHDDVAQVSCEVYKKTIAVTSAALDASAYGLGTNVGTEEYLYSVGARSTSNCRADEFVITDPLEMVEKYGIRITRLWTGTCPAGADFDGLMCVLYQTNKNDRSQATALSKQDVLSASFSNPNNPEGVLSQSLESGWLVWAKALPTTQVTELSVADLGLSDDEYITALRFVYGDVDKGFFTGSDWNMAEGDRYYNASYAGQSTNDWRYAVKASRMLEPMMGSEETVIDTTVTSHIARNACVLTDDAEDEVETRVISSLAYASAPPSTSTTPPDGTVPSLPKTGDGMTGLTVTLATLAAISFLVVILSLPHTTERRRKEAPRI